MVEIEFAVEKGVGGQGDDKWPDFRWPVPLTQAATQAPALSHLTPKTEITVMSPQGPYHHPNQTQ